MLTADLIFIALFVACMVWVVIYQANVLDKMRREVDEMKKELSEIWNHRGFLRR